MTTPIIEIERISIVTPIQGRDGSVMAERVLTFAGETRAIAPVNLYVGDFDDTALPQAVRDAIAAINTQLQSRIDTLTAERDKATADLATATQQLESSQALVAQRDEQIAALQAQIATLNAKAETPVATLSQIRVWLLQNLGPNAIKQVDSMIAAIPDDLQRLIAFQQWEYANNVLRDNPFFLLIGQQLGLTTEQMDEAYLAAARIV